MRRLVLVILRPFAGGLALRAFALLVLPPVFDGRAISAPKGQQAILPGQTFILEGVERARIVLATAPVMSEAGQSCRSDCARITSGLPPKADNLRAGRHVAKVPIGD
jgi:hypothetical protein